MVDNKEVSCRSLGLSSWHQMHRPIRLVRSEAVLDYSLLSWQPIEIDNTVYRLARAYKPYTED